MGRVKSHKGFIISGTIVHGYVKVRVKNYHTGAKTIHNVHRLVIASFMGTNEELKVNHKKIALKQIINWKT